jgi:2-oxoglutarate dehydrogenase E2 component (dihydrolipoamide succinyltransferase)
LIYKRAINIGMAVDLGDEGLIVPVIKNADEKSLRGLARAVTDLAERARAKALAPDDVQGGTFSLTNHGVIGSLFATPIIPMPQLGILGMGAIQKRPVVFETELGDTIAIRPMAYLSLTFDHRAIDGATADRFLATVVAYLEGYGD